MAKTKKKTPKTIIKEKIAVYRAMKINPGTDEYFIMQGRVWELEELFNLL